MNKFALCLMSAALSSPVLADSQSSFPVNPLARYGLPEMANIWSDEYRFKTYFDIEGYINEALAKMGILDKALPDRYWKNGNFAVEKIREHEKVTQHEFLAFLAAVGESLGDDAKSVHYGVTSSNVLDTGFNVQLSKSLELIDKELDQLIANLKTVAEKHKKTLCIGRTHGMHAEPLSFGVKMLRFYTEFKRHKKWLALAKEDIETCAIGGAVGNFVNIDPDVEVYVADKLKFKAEPVSSQVIPRDRYARLFSILAVVASSIENLATEIRHMQRSEVAEAQEPFKSGQKGSSAMPHKRNPIKCENLVGMARLIRSTVIPSMENQALWHERDMSHSSVERFTATQSMILTHYALNTMAKIIDGLVVHEDNMKQNIEESGNVFFSQRLMLALVKKGVSRDDAYKLIQKSAHRALDEKQDFTKVVRETKEFTDKLSAKELDDIFDINYYLKNVDVIFKRALSA